MKDFFANMNFPRAVIVISLLASCALGWLLYEGHARRIEVRDEFRRAPHTVRAIQELALQLDTLQANADESTREALTDLEYYVRRIATDPAVRIGQLETVPGTTTFTKDVTDHRVKIKPKNTNVHFGRTQIGNYLYKLEADSPRVKVTNIRMDPVQKMRPGEIGDDRWDFEAEITTRQSDSGS